MFATLFDFDGVLVDSEPVHLAAFNDVLAPHGLSIESQAYAKEYMSLDDAGVFRSVLSAAGRGVQEHEVRALVDAKSPRFLARFAESFRVFPGAGELVTRRAARGPVGIVSGALEREIAFALDKMGVTPAISFIVSADSAIASKPDPAPYRLALEKLLGLVTGEPTALRVVVVEDSQGGVISAKRAGLRCVAVAHSCASEDLLQAGADAVVADVASLTDAVLEGSA